MVSKSSSRRSSCSVVSNEGTVVERSNSIGETAELTDLQYCLDRYVDFFSEPLSTHGSPVSMPPALAISPVVEQEQQQAQSRVAEEQEAMDDEDDCFELLLSDLSSIPSSGDDDSAAHWEIRKVIDSSPPSAATSGLGSSNSPKAEKLLLTASDPARLGSYSSASQLEGADSIRGPEYVQQLEAAVTRLQQVIHSAHGQLSDAADAMQHNLPLGMELLLTAMDFLASPSTPRRHRPYYHGQAELAHADSTISSLGSVHSLVESPQDSVSVSSPYQLSAVADRSSAQSSQTRQPSQQAYLSRLALSSTELSSPFHQLSQSPPIEDEFQTPVRQQPARTGAQSASLPSSAASSRKVIDVAVETCCSPASPSSLGTDGEPSPAQGRRMGRSNSMVLALAQRRSMRSGAFGSVMPVWSSPQLDV